MIDKKGEKDFEFIYAYLCFCIYWVYASCVLENEKNAFKSLNKKGEKSFWKKDFGFMFYVSHLVDACLVV